MKRFVFQTALLACLATGFWGCSTPKTAINYGKDERTNVVTYNIEFVAQPTPELEIKDRCDTTRIVRSVPTDTRPRLILVPKVLAGLTSIDTLVYIEGLPCTRGGSRPTYTVPISRVASRTYTSTSDPLEPPTVYNITEVIPDDRCCRTRTGWWVFDKLDLRFGVGVRFGSDSVTYPIVDATGAPIAPFQEIYRSSLIGFDRGGSNLVGSLEAAGLWKLDNMGKGHLGPWLSFMPVDGSMFIPVGLYGRYTFSPTPPIEDRDPSCNTPYLYGIAAMPLDFQTGAAYIGSSTEKQRYLFGAGIGYDWAVNCELDFSVDLGLRQMNLPLPEIECCPNVDGDERYPFRRSTMLMLRVGLTW